MTWLLLLDISSLLSLKKAMPPLFSTVAANRLLHFHMAVEALLGALKACFLCIMLFARYFGSLCLPRLVLLMSYGALLLIYWCMLMRGRRLMCWISCLRR